MVLWSLILAAFLLIGTWVGGYFLAWPLWLKIAITAAVVVAVVLVIVLRRLRAVLQARRLERDMLKQAEEQAANARPDRRAEILELQMQLRRGIASLKSSKLGQGGQTALYTLPWYILVGPPGAGKTTALKHSGLAFPFLDQTGGGVRGIGGTRNCDWWFTNEGILLDTAGRYTSEADDHEEWLAFLGMLQKYRSRKPINGVLVAISVTELRNATEEELDVQAKRLRTRIDEVMTRLRMVVPVYILFTKMDLVAGFVEFWGDLRKSERAQVWGVTFPLTTAAKDAANAFESEFDVLAQTLHARAVRRIGQERTPEARRAVFHFPLEFQSLRTNLSDFVSAMFQPNAFQETPILRGVYFTSGTQEGSPVDQVIGGMLRAFNIGGEQQIEAPPPKQEQKSYFVTDMFRRIVFPDQNYAGRTKSELRRQLVNRIAFAAAALLLASLLVVPSSCTFARNRGLLERTETVATEAGKVPWSDPRVSTVDKAKRLDAVREQLRELDTWKREGAPLNYRWGMYVGDDLYEPLRGVYVQNLQIGFATPTKARLEDELRAIPDSGGLSTEQYNQYFNRLKAYVEACERDRLEVDWETTALTDAWGRALGATAKAEKDVLSPHVNYYLELLKRGEINPWTCDENLKTRVRSFLKRVSAADRDYSALIRDANENVAPITRESIFLNTAFGTYVTSKSSPEVFVSGAFTKEGWEKYIRDRLGKDRAKQLAVERWVLGETEKTSETVTKQQLDALRERYFTNFTRAWAEFLKDLDVRKPTSNDEALEELSALSEVPWPYQRLMNSLNENVHLEESDGERAEREIERRAQEELKRSTNPLMRILGDAGIVESAPQRWISPPEAAFTPMTKFGVAAGPTDPTKPTPTQLGHYQDQIVAGVVALLTELRDSKGKGVEGKAVFDKFEGAIRATNELITPSQSGFTRPILSPLLLNPIEMSWAGVQSDLRGVEGGNWEAGVWSKWRSKLMDGYPFQDTWKDVKLADYTEFFAPNKGLLFGFYEASLKGSIDRVGDRFVPNTRFGHTPNYTGPFLKCYDRGLEISRATFPENGTEPLVTFEINLHSVSENIAEVTFDINGVSHTYKNTPEEWLPVQWPAKDAKSATSRVRIQGWSSLDEEVKRDGEWGFFRLLDAAHKIELGTAAGKRNGQPTIVVTWTLRSQQGLVKMDIKPSKDDSVFPSYIQRKQRIFKPYECPRVIASGGR